MQSFRPRWPDRSGVIVAIAGMSVGMLLCRPAGLVPDGPGLVAWVIAVFVLAIPFVVLELGTGAIYQDSLGESCRKAGKQWELVGWLATGAALLAMLLLAMTAGHLGLAAYDSVLAAIADQPSPWVANAEDTVAPREGGELVAIAAVLGVVLFRLWRGASAIARSGLIMGVIAFTGLVLVGGSLLLHPGAMDGLRSLLSAGSGGWQTLGSVDPWLGAGIAVLVGWACGTGAVTVYGSYLNRSTDAIGIGTISVLSGALAQVLLLAVLAIGSGVIVADGSHDQSTRLPSDLIAVAAALANSGLPMWWAGLLLSVWFIALLAVAIPALLAMSEVLVAALVDKFSLPRERVVPAVGLVLFFLTAVLLAEPRTSAWCFHGFLWVLVMALIGQAACSVAAVKLDAVARHLNAYSAFHLGWAWRLSVAGAMPLAAIVLLIVLAIRDPTSAVIGGGMATAVLVAGVVLVRLTGRNL